MPPGGEHVQKMLADPGIHIASHRVFTCVDPVVPPSPAGPTR